ncbi:MAG: M2 family metallopeptidase [bacterium]|nr:M2 family metallopeptidase [bacterium]
MKQLLLVALTITLLAGCSQQNVDDFLADYNILYKNLWTAAEGARWDDNTNICEENSQKRIVAEQAYAQQLGSAELIEKAQAFLERDNLTELQTAQLNYVLLNAAKFPGTIPKTVDKLIKAEADQNSKLYTFDYTVNGQPVTPNDIVNGLGSSRNLAERLELWEASKAIGPSLKPGLIELRDLRNEVARSMGYSSYFGLECSEYGMSSNEMVELMDELIDGLNPLFIELHTWTARQLANRYNQPVPETIPAHWIDNRWAQSWPGLVEGINLDELVDDKSPQWLVEQGERYYTSMGFPALPQTFWDKSDLYALPADATRKKNTHASAWHIDLDNDVRSLMSVENTFDWFQTTHHELGHIYYYMLYSNDDVPFVLRTGANRGMHEGVGTLIELAGSQVSYLKEIGLLEGDVDQIQWLLNQALVGPVTFMPFACGTMTHWEHDFYEEELTGEQMNARWWQYVEQYQGVTPPSARSEEWCDAATKTHINDDPAQYYDYAISNVILHQLHDYICREILHESPQTANYYGNTEVGDWLKEVLKQGAACDWRELMVEATGEKLSSRAMLEYFAPLMEWLEAENNLVNKGM